MGRRLCKVALKIIIPICDVRSLCRLAENPDAAPSTTKTPAELREDLEKNKAKRKIINELQAKNRYGCVGTCCTTDPVLVVTVMVRLTFNTDVFMFDNTRKHLL